MKHLLFIFIFTLAGCSFVPNNVSELLANQKDSPFGSGNANPELSLEQKAILYPQFNVGVAGFAAVNEDPLSATATDAQKIYARTFSAQAKLYKLQSLDFIRFVIHTPEFEEALLKTKFILKREGTGTLGKSLATDVADHKRFLAILRSVESYSMIISKRKIASGTVAQAVVGRNRYNDPPTYFNNTTQVSTVWFRSDDILEKGTHADTQGYMMGVFFHEILHNLGFGHNDYISGTDVVYGVQGVLRSVSGNKAFLTKYATELARFRPYYEKKYSQYLLADTLVGIATNQSRSRSLQDVPEYQHDPDELVCVTYEDGTSRMMTFAEAERINRESGSI